MRIRKPNTKPVEAMTRSVSEGKTAGERDTIALDNAVYRDSITYVYRAIESLGAYSRRCPDDEFAKEQIANLSVILMELKANSSEFAEQEAKK